MQPPAMELSDTNEVVKEGLPYHIYIMHETGVRVEQISQRNSNDFIVSAYHKLMGDYGNCEFSAALYAPDGRRLAYDIHIPSRRMN